MGQEVVEAVVGDDSAAGHLIDRLMFHQHVLDPPADGLQQQIDTGLGARPYGVAQEAQSGVAIDLPAMLRPFKRFGQRTEAGRHPGVRLAVLQAPKESFVAVPGGEVLGLGPVE
ncbi:hypothetical protein [Streptomyces anthocyanicus]|uniref:hypothetical protein n=1 Tax=Streptomyces violaceoruber group TaxID=2867121 RepID=UPI0018757BF5|nr:hypothetical protein [Streptomyces anthocyanicus]WTC46251.1 hypothetical protein OG855_00195 [Streptomyces anthocyanicus]